MKRSRPMWLTLGVIAIVGLAVSGYFIWQGSRDGELTPMPLFIESDGTSNDLTADIERMWKTQPLNSTIIDPPTNSKASTAEAISAASRVFNTVDLVGKTREEVIALLGDPKQSNDSVYNFPFYPARKGSLVYRFDTGRYGWQFNVVSDRSGRVNQVQRYCIE